MSDTANTPIVGAGATLHMPHDKDPYVVVKVSPSGAKVTLAVLVDPEKPSKIELDGMIVSHEYTAEEIEASKRENWADCTITAHRRNDGRYYNNSCQVTFDGARYRRNYANW